MEHTARNALNLARRYCLASGADQKTTLVDRELLVLTDQLALTSKPGDLCAYRLLGPTPCDRHRLACNVRNELASFALDVYNTSVRKKDLVTVDVHPGAALDPCVRVDLSCTPHTWRNGSGLVVGYDPPDTVRLNLDTVLRLRKNRRRRDRSVVVLEAAQVWVKLLEDLKVSPVDLVSLGAYRSSSGLVHGNSVLEKLVHILNVNIGT